MKITQHTVSVVARPALDWDNVRDFLQEVGGLTWFDRVYNELDPRGAGMPDMDGEMLVEFGGRECYRSWDVGLNPNVTKVRQDSKAYLENILAQAHGSVLQHANYSLILHNVTRVATHELVRHVAGTAFSQESMRYVRLTDIPMWIPEWALADDELMGMISDWVAHTEELQYFMARHFDLDATKRCPTCMGAQNLTQPCARCGGSGEVAVTPMHEKKAMTSFMRRFSPQGVSTGMVMTANVRALRWIVERRTESAAEEEIRLVAAAIGECMKEECPTLFGDFEVNEEGEWIPKHRKV